MVNMPNDLTVVMYHYVRPVPDPDYPYLKVCGLDRFLRQLDWLAEHHRMIAWTDLAAYIGRGADLPPAAALLTFDDGLRDGYLHVFPELKKRGVSGLFFPMARRPEEGLAPVQTLQLLANRFPDPDEFRQMLFEKFSPAERDLFSVSLAREAAEYPPDRFGENKLRSLRRVLNTYMFRESEAVLEDLCRERIGDPKALGAAFYLGDREIREMSRAGMYFGGHGLMHHRMTRLTPNELAAEVLASRELLSLYGFAQAPFSYPYGDYNSDVIARVRDAGFFAAFADRLGAADQNRWTISRVDTVDLPPR